jgi:hypothetical protein
MTISQLEASKNVNIQARFDSKSLGTKSRLYRVTLIDGVVANVIFNNGEELDDAIACMKNHYGKKLANVEQACS